MRSALPYIGILLLLAVFSVAISLFFGKGENFNTEDGSGQGQVNFGGSEFPEIENNNGEFREGAVTPQPYQKNEQESSVESKKPADLLQGILLATEKDSRQNSFMFKWKTSKGSTGFGEALATGKQIIFQGTNEDAAIAKEYLRQQGFSSDFANTKSSEGYNFEGFSKESIACVVVSAIQMEKSFQENDSAEVLDEVRVYCGEIK